MLINNSLMKKWAPLLESKELPEIKDKFRKAVTAVLLENQEKANRVGNAHALMEAGETPNNVSGDFGAPNSNNTTNISGYDPIMISLVRRAMPNLVAYDICGVQPMTMPSSLIFAMRSRYIGTGDDSDLTNNTEAFYNEADSDFSGTGTHAGNNPAVLNNASPGTFTRGTGYNTATGEALGSTGGDWPEMGFTIEKVSVLAKTRALKASYTVELAQDLKQVHGLDAETELANILSGEILAEINREILRTVYIVAKKGAQQSDLANAGVYDLDVDSGGRWSAEKYKGMHFQIEREANQIAKETRRGRGNIILCSADVASALAISGKLDVAPALQTNLEVDDTGNTFVGVLNGKYKVYIDPYAIPSTPTAEADSGHNFFVVGYRGSSQYDAGIFYCPYVPLQMFRATDSETMQPKIGFKTRYGVVANPFAEGATAGLGALTANANVYYRRTKVINLVSAATV
jgi:hypothetical protein